MEGKTVTNWAGTFSCSPELYFEPSSVDEIKQIFDLARRKSKTVKCGGEYHSPSDIAMTEDYMINLKKMNHVIEVNKDKCQVKVEGGCTLHSLGTKILPQHGMALSNLSSISRVSIAGVISTGTHGTGANKGILATQVVELELLTAQCELLHCSHDDNPDLFRAALCSLGSLGVIVAVTIQCEPEFKLARKQTSCTFEEALITLEDDVTTSEFFSFGWFPHTEGVVQYKLERTKEPDRSSGNRFIPDRLFFYYILQPLYWLCSFLQKLTPSVNRFIYNWWFTAPRCDVASCHDSLTIDCLFKQYVTEWAIPRCRCAMVLRELKSWLEANKDVNVHFPVEVRFVKEDDIMLSPAHGSDTCFINIVMYRPYGKFVPFAKYWAAFEDIMFNAGGRPHWAKQHKLTSKELTKSYPDFEKFSRIRKSMDPEGMFLNKNLEKIFHS